MAGGLRSRRDRRAPGQVRRRVTRPGAPPGPGDGHREAGTAVLPSGGVPPLYQGPARSRTRRDGHERRGQGRPAPGGPRTAGRKPPSGWPPRFRRSWPTWPPAAKRTWPTGPARRCWPCAPRRGRRARDGAGRGPAPDAARRRSMDLLADPLALRGLRTRLRDRLRELGASAADRTDVELAVWEAAVTRSCTACPRRGPASATVRTALDETGPAVIQASDRWRWNSPEPPQAGRRWPGGQARLATRQAVDELALPRARRGPRRPCAGASATRFRGGPARGVPRDCARHGTRHDLVQAGEPRSPGDGLVAEGQAELAAVRADQFVRAGEDIDPGRVAEDGPGQVGRDAAPDIARPWPSAAQRRPRNRPHRSPGMVMWHGGPTS